MTAPVVESVPAIEAIPVVEAIEVTRILPGAVPVTLVHDVNLAFARGEFVAITGPSGSGKSSLLYLLGLLDRPTSGAILMDGEDTATMSADDLARRRLAGLGFVFQFHFLLPEFTILDNVLIPMRKLGREGRAGMRDKAAATLERLGLGEHAHKRPDQISGGERQRAAIARAIANDPAIVLADEPTGNLDRRNGEIVFDIFAELARRDGRTVITITHDPELAGRTDRRVRIVDGGIVDGERAASLGGVP